MSDAVGIVIDAATPPGAKIGPPQSGRPGKLAGYVACLRVALPRDCAALLASGLPRAITIRVLVESRP